MFVKSFYIPSAAMANMLILFYLFCSGKMEDNLAGIFNLFDQDGNKVARWKSVENAPTPQIITLNELYELMSVFIEIAEGKENNVSGFGHHGYHHKVYLLVGNNWCGKRKTSSSSPIGEAQPILCCDLSCPSWTWRRWWRRCSSWATRTRTMWDCRHPLSWFHLSHIF